MKYIKFSYDFSRIFGNLKVQFEDALGTLWNNGLPFLSGVLFVSTENLWYLLLFFIPALLEFKFRFINEK